MNEMMTRRSWPGGADAQDGQLLSAPLTQAAKAHPGMLQKTTRFRSAAVLCPFGWTKRQTEDSQTKGKETSLEAGPFVPMFRFCDDSGPGGNVEAIAVQNAGTRRNVVPNHAKIGQIVPNRASDGSGNREPVRFWTDFGPILGLVPFEDPAKGWTKLYHVEVCQVSAVDGE